MQSITLLDQRIERYIPDRRWKTLIFTLSARTLVRRTRVVCFDRIIYKLLVLLKIDFDLTIEDVADMMDEDNTVITQCMELFIASFVKPNSEEKK